MTILQALFFSRMIFENLPQKSLKGMNVNTIANDLTAHDAPIKLHISAIDIGF
jgi:hypothetical protein